MASFSAIIQGDDKLFETLSSILVGSVDRDRLFQEWGSGLVENAQLRFAEGVGPNGVAWPVSIRAANDNGQTLIDTGRLRASMTFETLLDGVEYGTNVAYGKYLHYGAEIKASSAEFLAFKIGDRFTKKKQVTLPPRPIVGVSAEDEIMLIDVFNNFIGRLEKR